LAPSCESFHQGSSRKHSGRSAHLVLEEHKLAHERADDNIDKAIKNLLAKSPSVSLSCASGRLQIFFLGGPEVIGYD